MPWLFLLSSRDGRRAGFRLANRATVQDAECCAMPCLQENGSNEKQAKADVPNSVSLRGSPGWVVPGSDWIGPGLGTGTIPVNHGSGASVPVSLPLGVHACCCCVPPCAFAERRVGPERWVGLTRACSGGGGGFDGLWAWGGRPRFTGSMNNMPAGNREFREQALIGEQRAQCVCAHMHPLRHMHKGPVGMRGNACAGPGQADRRGAEQSSMAERRPMEHLGSVVVMVEVKEFETTITDEEVTFSGLGRQASKSSNHDRTVVILSGLGRQVSGLGRQASKSGNHDCSDVCVSESACERHCGVTDTYTTHSARLSSLSPAVPERWTSAAKDEPRLHLVSSNVHTSGKGHSNQMSASGKGHSNQNSLSCLGLGPQVPTVGGSQVSADESQWFRCGTYCVFLTCREFPEDGWQEVEAPTSSASESGGVCEHEASQGSVLGSYTNCFDFGLSSGGHPIPRASSPGAAGRCTQGVDGTDTAKLDDKHEMVDSSGLAALERVATEKTRNFESCYQDTSGRRAECGDGGEARDGDDYRCHIDDDNDGESCLAGRHITAHMHARAPWRLVSRSIRALRRTGKSIRTSVHHAPRRMCLGCGFLPFLCRPQLADRAGRQAPAIQVLGPRAAQRSLDLTHAHGRGHDVEMYKVTPGDGIDPSPGLRSRQAFACQYARCMYRCGAPGSRI